MLDYTHDEWVMMGMYCPPMVILLGTIEVIHFGILTTVKYCRTLMQTN